MCGTAIMLRSICSQLVLTSREYVENNQHDEARQVDEAEGGVRRLLGLPEPGDEA